MKTLLSLLRKYTWCIPSATNTMPDISLYDHLKTTAAIAVCLHDSEQIEEYGKLPETFDGLKEEEKNRFALLVGDFSGIQKFIYQLTSKGAAKTDRKSTRLNSSHVATSYAVFCLKKKKT